MKPLFIVLLFASTAAHADRTQRNLRFLELCANGYGYLSAKLPFFSGGPSRAERLAEDKTERVRTHFSDPLSGEPHPIETSRIAPWRVDPAHPSFRADSLFNLHMLVRREDYAPLMAKLGIRATETGTEVAPQKKVNEGLTEIDSPFRVVSVEGEIPFEPWLDLMAQGKYPVGTDHDLETHFAGVALMPKELGLSLQGEIGFLRKIQTDLPMPHAVAKLIGSRLGKIGAGFEVESYRIGRELADSPPGEVSFERLAYFYQGLHARKNAYIGFGAANEAKDIKLIVLSDWKKLGFLSLDEAKQFNAKVDALLAELEKKDPARYSATVASSDLTKVVSERFSKLSLAP